MRDFNPFTQWARTLTFEQLRDVRRYFGALGGDPSQDAKIGMYLNGIAFDGYLVGTLPRLPRLRKNFAPEMSPLAAALYPQIPAHQDVIAAFSRPDVDRFIEQILWPAEKVWRGQPNAFSMTVDGPETLRTKEEILAQIYEAKEMVQRFQEEERRRRLTNPQIIQLCAYFKLYSLDGIIQFIEEHRR